MLTNGTVNQYSPNSDESYDQPLDFSAKARPPSTPSLTNINVKQEVNGKRRDRHSTDKEEKSRPLTNKSSSREPSVTNCFTTPSPSPPEHNPNNHHNSNQVLCQLLTGNLISTPTGKLVSNKSSANALSIQQQLSAAENAQRYNGQSLPILSVSSPPQAKNLQSITPFGERHNSPLSPTGSVSPIGMGPLNQVEMHFPHSPSSTGIDRFGTSGGLLTTASHMASLAVNDTAKRSLKHNRPFKAYPRDPLSIPMNYYALHGLQMPMTPEAIATQSIMATASDQAYLQFREQMLVSRKSTHEQTRRTSDGQQSMPKNSTQTTSASLASPPINSNGNNNGTNDNNLNQNSIYMNQNVCQSTTPPKQQVIPIMNPKMNGSLQPMSTASHINTTDDTSQYSNGNSSGNSSSGEADVGSMALNCSSKLENGHNISDDSNDDQLQHSHNQHLSASALRKRGRPLPEDLKDDAYWERRRKNNEAAKRSRDARRAKEDEIAIRAAFLEQENLKLRVEIAQLKSETNKLRCLLYSS
ncbi:GATA zinc finger domain-containing protein 7-like [Oppia nitens]|uniref:GATA zinc finger domain-containing protein 7-like n=1 Tax=Oppia nitens TaxID=1686743 RepID=UPI0023DABDE3|nr:GATA zinc finger domain-containing protein 7-like [Oppia nitens]